MIKSRKVVTLCTATLVAFSIFGCAGAQSELENQKARSKEFVEKSGDYTIMDKIEENKKQADSILIYPNQKLSSVLKALGLFQDKYYMLQGKDFEIVGSRPFKVHSFEELNDYIKTVSNYEIVVTKNMFTKNLPKIVEVREQKQATILDRIQFTSKLYQVPSHVFSELSVLAEGWRVVDDADYKIQFDSKQYVTFTGTLREFLEYFAKNNNVFIDLDYQKKEIYFKKYKTKHFPLAINTETIDFNNEIQTSMDEDEGSTSKNSGSGGNKNTGKITLKNKYDLVGSVKTLLEKIIPKDSNEYWQYFDATSELVVKTVPERMETIEKIVESVNVSALKKVYMQVSVYQVTLNKRYQNGIDWGYFNNVANSAGTVSRVTAGSTGGLLPTVDTSLGSPNIFKYSGEGLNAVVKLLNEFGDSVSMEQFPLVTTNNIPAIYNTIKREGYISSFASSTVVNAGTQSSVEQSKAVGGSYVYLKPTLFHDKIFMSIKLIRATVDNMIKRDIGNGQYIQTPNDSRDTISQNLTLNSGEKIIIGGLIQKKDKKGYNGISPDGDSVLSSLVGTNDKDFSNKEVVLVVEVKEL